MPRYLSQEWLDELRTLSQDLPTGGTIVKIQYRTTGGPRGDIDYYWVLEDGKMLEAKVGSLPDADATLTMSYDDAAKVQQGDLDPNAAFMMGKVQMSGNVAKVMALLPLTNSSEWKALQDKLRTITEY